MNVRSVTEVDAEQVAAIYGHHVLHGLGTFEEVPPTPAEIAGRIQAVLAHGLPYLVAEDAGRITGFAYAAPFRPRSAYRFTVEDSVYIHPDHIGHGVGRRLVARVIEACEAMGLRQMIAVIGDSANAGSINLHRSLGFTDAGVGRALGFKHGRWVDIVWMRRSLNAGADAPPDGVGLEL